jgi:predicted amidohydrolase YtcJ
MNGSGRDMTKIDRVIVNGRVRTLDAEGTVASALAVSDGVIVAVGRDDEILELAGNETERIDAGDRAVLPAFIDSHTHLRRASLVLSYYLDFLGTDPTRLQDVLDAVRLQAERRPAGSWIQGDSLQPRRLDVGRYPTRWELDAVAPDHPVVVRGIGRHVAAANSLALRIAGIDRDTLDPPGGRLERTDDGEVTGVLHEHGKLRLDATRSDTVIPIPTEEDRVTALRDTMSLLHSYGIACVHEMAREPNDVGDYLRLREADGLGVRVRFYIRGLEAQTRLEWVTGLGLRSEFGDDWMRLGGIKFSIDGSESAHNAALYEEYPDEPGNTGLLRIQPDALNEAVGTAHRAGLQVAVHSIGQRAVDIALDAFQLAQRQHPSKRLRHRVEHAYTPLNPGQLERIAELGLIWSPQPAFMHTQGEEWASVFGEERGQRVLPFKTAAELGIPIQFNSDYPCSPMSPFIGLQTAVTRTTEHGNVFGADEAISVDTALRYMTAAASYSTTNGRQGILRPGNVADVMILNRDPYEIPGDEITSIEIALTMVDGNPVYRKF